MREIVFRGKAKDGKEWIYGFYVNGKETTYAFAEDYEKHPVKTHHWIAVDEMTDWAMPNRIRLYEVNEETVGQYTGLKDKNGKEIYEGDIIRYTFDSPDDSMATQNGLIPRIGRVFWSEWRASFAVTCGKNGSGALNNDVARYVRGKSIYEYVRGANTVEVIGDVFDNPELLKGDKEND